MKRTRRNQGTGLLLTTLLALTATAAAQEAGDPTADGHWPGFRGHRARGVAEGWETPVEWNVATGENVLWSTPVPGLAHSSPVVWGDRIFLTTAVRKDGEAELSSLYGSPGYGAGESVPDEGPHLFQVLCLDANTGKLLWERTAHEGVPKVKRHPKASHASSTPACDAERVVAFFGSEGLFCYTHEGELSWSRDFGVLDAGAPGVGNPEEYQWGFASSPVLEDGRVIVQCDVQGQSFLTVLDAATGKDLWRTDRDEDPTWSTPTLHERAAGGRSQVIANGYKHVGGYDLATGEEIWKLVGGGDVPVPTPIVALDMIYMTSAHGRLAPIWALSTEAEGLVTMDAEACEPMVWAHPRRGIYMQTPIVYGEEIYLCSDGGVLTCRDALTGDEIYRERLGSGRSGFSGSAVAADGKLYFSGENGEISVVRPGWDFELLAVNDMGETVMATPAITKGRLLVRTRGNLVCIGGGSE